MFELPMSETSVMVTFLDAPKRMGSRKSAQGLIRELPFRLQGHTVEVHCRDSWPTTSFIDELVIEIIERRDATNLVFIDGSETLQEVASWCARSRGLEDRVICRNS